MNRKQAKLLVGALEHVEGLGAMSFDSPCALGCVSGASPLELGRIDERLLDDPVFSALGRMGFARWGNDGWEFTAAAREVIAVNDLVYGDRKLRRDAVFAWARGQL